LKNDDRYYEKELLSGIQKYNEYVMVSLRTIWGCDLSKIRDIFGEEYAVLFEKQVAQYLNNRMVVEKRDIYSLTDEGKLFADRIASDLFMETEEGTQG
jgi:oxygen-independent coproporphyrinogen-3 oxidase